MQCLPILLQCSLCAIVNTNYSWRCAQFASHLVGAVGIAFEPCPVLGLCTSAVVNIPAVLQDESKTEHTCDGDSNIVELCQHPFC